MPALKRGLYHGGIAVPILDLQTAAYLVDVDLQLVHFLISLFIVGSIHKDFIKDFI